MKDNRGSRKPKRDDAPDEPEVPNHQARDRDADPLLTPFLSETTLYQRLVESVRDYAIFALDTRGYIRSWNAGAQRFKGYTAEEAIGKHFSIFYPRELVAEGFPEFELRTAANTGRFEDNGWRLRKDGSRFWANVVITALRDADGQLLGFAKITRDLTERRNAEEALRMSEQNFRLLVEGVRDVAIYMLDPEGRVATWNRGAERIKGYVASEIVGRSFATFYPPEDIAARLPERHLEIAATTGKVEEEGWRVRHDGTRFWAGVLITSLRDKSGQLVGFAKITRDLTERRALQEQALADARRVAAEEAKLAEAAVREQELRQLAAKLRRQTAQLETRTRDAREAQRRADAANRAKSEFLTAMSHELRTPLNAIGGYADLLLMGLSGPVTPQQTEQLGRVKRSQEHLLGIINDILNFSRVEAGQLTYDIDSVPVHEVVDAVVRLLAPQAAAKGVRLAATGCGADRVAWADRIKTEQIVLNLVANAVKFTSAGGSVGVSCDLLDADRIALRVADTGCGIPADQLEAVFEPFVQVGRTLTSQPEGAGLGLAISRDLARAMKGDIQVESTVDVGSTFTLTLPVRKDDRAVAR
ncbi:MAG TPA: PAS domain S-box protein [Gemmatimonadaceae bacterium]|jgi:PAS domain S-box-containing protein|nr:PAS domain S-box protein [Gemmatimonadaceae bacterium]